MLTQAAATQQHPLMKEMEQVKRDLQQLSGRCEHHSGAEGDVADRASWAMNTDIQLALLHSSEKTLEQMKKAHERLLEGQYGICESCGEQIDPERMHVVPYATLCIRCQRQSERRRKRKGEG